MSVNAYRKICIYVIMYGNMYVIVCTYAGTHVSGFYVAPFLNLTKFAAWHHDPNTTVC